MKRSQDRQGWNWSMEKTVTSWRGKAIQTQGKYGWLLFITLLDERHCRERLGQAAPEQPCSLCTPLEGPSVQEPTVSSASGKGWKSQHPEWSCSFFSLILVRKGSSCLRFCVWIKDLVKSKLSLGGRDPTHLAPCTASLGKQNPQGNKRSACMQPCCGSQEQQEVFPTSLTLTSHTKLYLLFPFLLAVTVQSCILLILLFFFALFCVWYLRAASRAVNKYSHEDHPYFFLHLTLVLLGKCCS